MSMKQKATLKIVELKEDESLDDGDYRPTASNKGNKHLYAYRFLGGRKGRGHLSSRLDEGPQEYELELLTKGYLIESITFIGDAKQLEHTNKGACSNLATIANKNGVVMQGYYHVMVRREATDELIDCDPMISNDPRRY